MTVSLMIVKRDIKVVTRPVWTMTQGLPKRKRNDDDQAGAKGGPRLALDLTELWILKW